VTYMVLAHGRCSSNVALSLNGPRPEEEKQLLRPSLVIKINKKGRRNE